MIRSWNAGSAVVDITPPIGTELAGYVAREQGAMGIHDKLYAKALVVDNGVRRVGMLTCDLLGIDAGDARFVRGMIEEKTGIPRANLMIAASHTHSGPATLHTIGIGERDEQWMRILLDKMIACVENAARTVEPVTLREAAGTAEIGINRRGKIPEGDINPLPDPAGAVDRGVSVICVDRVRTKKPWIVLLNCGCHPAVLGADNRLVSADYVGVATRYVEGALGDGSVAMFTNGGAGNVNPIQNGSFDVATRLGEQLGTAVVNLVYRQGGELHADLEASSVSVDLPFAPVPSIETARGLVKRYTMEAATADTGSAAHRIAEACLSWSRKLERLANEGRVPTKITIEVQRLRLGNVRLIAVPAEVFAETALALKGEGKPRTILVGYANGDVGYLPPAEEIAKGGYEVLEAHKYYGCPTHFAPEAEERVRAVSITPSEQNHAD